MKNFFRNLGPGILVSAAFIGPGTVTVCSLAGVAYGYSLLWALLVSLIACIVLQEMSARLGLVTGKGLSDSIRQSITSPVFRIVALILIYLVRSWVCKVSCLLRKYQFLEMASIFGVL
jgi:manganese transport protein